MTPEAARQPPVPDTLRRLTDGEGERLSRTGHRQWNNPGQICLTCIKHEKPDIDPNPTHYRWYAPGSRRPEDVLTYQCVCTDQYRLFRWMAWSGIGLNYMRMSWDDNLDMDQEAIDVVANYALNCRYHLSVGNNLMLHSPESGTGKTFLASMLAKRLLHDGVDVYFATFADILDMFADSWRSEEDRRYFNDRVRSASTLIIDDLGREYQGRSGIAESMLDSVLRSRISSCLPTVFTTNLSENRLSAYGGNLVSLLSERMISQEVSGTDKRPLMRERTNREHLLGLNRPVVLV